MGKLISFFLFGIFCVLAYEASAARASPKRCPPIEGNNLKVKLNKRGRMAKFKCLKPYIMFEGDKHATCVRGQWNGRIPKCIAPGCEYYHDIPNGEALYLYNEALVQFLCQPGYTLEGSPALMCDGDNWNGTVPACQAPANASLSCDFEDEGFCGWMNDDVDHFDWTRNQGPATIFGAGTGPKTDHTLGTSRGHYMYIDSSIPRESGEKARLFSPVYSASVTDHSSCFAFYYHIFGNTTGNLNVYVKEESVNIEFLSPIYQMSGSNNDKWVLHVLHLDQIHTNFQIVLEGVQGVGYMSDIAIDDIQLAQGEDCDHLDEEFKNQYNNQQPETPGATTSAPTIADQPITIVPVNDSGTNGDSTLSVTTIKPLVTTVNQTLTSTKPQEPLLTTTVSIQQASQTIVLTTAAPTLVPTTTGDDSGEDDDKHEHIHDHEDQEDEDLNSCKNRCGEIAVENNTCGCDIMCNTHKTCCPDIQIHCPGYFTTPLPVTLSPSAVTVSPNNVISTTLKPTSIKQSDNTKSESIDGKSSATTVTTVSSSEVVSKTPTKATATVTNVTKIVTTTAKTQSSETTTVKTKSSITTMRPAIVTEAKTTSKPAAATTAPDKKIIPTEEITTILSLTTISAKNETVKVSTTSVAPEKVTISMSSDKTSKIYESTTVPSTGSAKSEGLSRIAVFAIAIGTTTAIILLVILTVTYIRKRRLDKLPEDSDIRFLARDEVMMEGNVFNLAGTLNQVRNTAI